MRTALWRIKPGSEIGCNLSIQKKCEGEGLAKLPFLLCVHMKEPSFMYNCTDYPGSRYSPTRQNGLRSPSVFLCESMSSMQSACFSIYVTFCAFMHLCACVNNRKWTDRHFLWNPSRRKMFKCVCGSSRGCQHEWPPVCVWFTRGKEISTPT